MKLRSLGATGLRVSELGFGAMTFGSGMGSIAKVDQAGADRMVGRALDAGINLFDTANVYAAGQSEEMLGRALGARRRDAVVATKLGFATGVGANQRGLSRAAVMAAVEASLRRLGTEWIDVLQLRTFRPGRPRSRSACSGSSAVRASRPPRCTTRSWGATWSTRSFPWRGARAWACWSGARWPAAI